MIQLESYTLLERVKDDFGNIPAGFLDDLPEGKSFVYLASCHEARMIFMEPSPRQVTGFTREEMMAGGIDMQISRIHPDDLGGLYDKALRIIRQNGKATQHGERITPLSLEYRIRRADGKWRVVRETKLYSYFEDGSRDHVLGKVVDVTERAANDRHEAEQFLADPRNGYPILDALYKFKKNTERQPILPSAEATNVLPAGITTLTKREKEILQQIGAGYSTKQIADHLFISVNTVQTHRSNLLQKLQVKNSMELIREVSKAFWL